MTADAKAAIVASAVALALVSGLVFVPQVAGGASPDYDRRPVDGPSVKSANLTSSSGVEYSVRFDASSYVVSVDAVNPTDRRVPSGFSIGVDGAYVRDGGLNFSSGETWQAQWNVTRSLDVLEDRHTITVSTFGAHASFEFEREIDASNPGPTSTPRIDDVTIAEGTIDGRPSAVALVTVSNPTIHTYPTKLMVHTQGTDGSFYGASVPPGESETITVELLDDRDSVIPGEARLYAGNLTEASGGFHQVGFVGRAGNRTSAWNQSYRPVRPPWADDRYQYHNATYAEDGFVDRVSERVPSDLSAAAVGAVVLVLARVLARRLRS